MQTFEYRGEVLLPRPLAEVFPFFADAVNLERLTPPWLRFRVLSPTPVEMRVGARIDYRLRVHSVPLHWQSEITLWEPPRRFVDEPRRGPYRLWRHLHEFEEVAGGTIVRDHVTCAVPGGWLVWKLLVERDVRSIFAYRRRVLGEIFGTG